MVMIIFPVVGGLIPRGRESRISGVTVGPRLLGWAPVSRAGRFLGLSGRAARGSARRWSRGRPADPGEGVEGLQRESGERRGGGQVQQPAAAGAGVAGRDAEQPQAQPFGLPAAGLVLGEGEGLHPGEQVGGERHQGAPDLVPGEVVQRQVGQPGVVGGADAVLGAGAAAVPQLEVGQLPAAGEGGRTR